MSKFWRWATVAVTLIAGWLTFFLSRRRTPDGVSGAEFRELVDRYERVERVDRTSAGALERVRDRGDAGEAVDAMSDEQVDEALRDRGML